MPTPTINYSFNLPVEGADDDVWGGLLNDNWIALDAQLFSGTIGADTTGNAATATLATAWATARTLTINGVSKQLDGTEDVEITLPAIATFPTGGIVMWSGSVASIPEGWFLCDGTNGTPDLRGRFIVGAGDAYAVNATGGANTVTLTEAQIPAHSHTGSTNTAGAHTHNYTAPTGSDTPFGSSGTAPRNTNSNATTGSGGAHSHSLTINNTGGGAAHENRPPYFALAYIMKG